MTSTPDPYNEADLTAILRERRVHPDDIGALLGYVPVALTQMCWRNSVVEDWHAGPNSRISDAEMMRANVSTTRIFSQNLWHAIGDRWAELGAFDHRTIDTDVLDDAFIGAFDEAFRPERVLPHGESLEELGGGELDELHDHARGCLGSLLDKAQRDGAHAVLKRLSAYGLIFVPTWWGTPRWPYIVDELFIRLTDPDHEHWTSSPHPGEPPTTSGSLSALRSMLLIAPDELSNEVIAYCIHGAGLSRIS